MSPETLAAFARVMFATFGGYVMSRPHLSAGTLLPPSAVVKPRSAAERMRFSVRRRILPPPGTIPPLLPSKLLNQTDKGVLPQLPQLPQLGEIPDKKKSRQMKVKF